MDSHKNLWGDLSQTDTLRTPFIILKEQAAMLAQQTKGLLIGDVQRLQQGTSNLLSLRIVAPSLGNYRYAVAQVTHDAQLYPLTIKSLADERFVKECDAEAEFEIALGEVLSSREVRKVIAALLSDIHADNPKESGTA
jgi:hypothetical protein